MSRKRIPFLVVGILCVSVFLSLAGCSSGEEVEAKELIVTNSSSVDLSGVSVIQNIGEAKISEEDTSLAAGESRTYHMAPYIHDAGITVRFIPEGGTELIYKSCTFTYDYKVGGKNKAVTVTFDGDNLTVNGSNAKEKEN